MSLNLSNLSQIQDCFIPKIKPTKARIAHFGVGNFHRAHECVYNQKTMELTSDSSWGILGVGIKQFDMKMNKILTQQDFMYCLASKDRNFSEKQIINTIVNHVDGFTFPLKAILQVGNIDIDILTFTITEGGYNMDQTTRKFNAQSKQIKKDIGNVYKIILQLQQKGIKLQNLFEIQFHEKFETVFPYLYLSTLLHQNKNHKLTFLSCDNIQKNGNVLKNCFLAFCQLIQQQHKNQKYFLSEWVEKHCTFPNCMVDRITPQTVQKDRQNIAKEIGITDSWPVSCERFIQWIIEDNFAGQRPKWELSGVQFVQEVLPYEKMKLRLLNSSHQMLCYLGFYFGYRYVHEAAQDNLFRQLLLRYMNEEVLQTLDEVPGIDLQKYQEVVIERFANSEVLDRLSRICQFTSDRIPLFNLISNIQIVTKNPNRRLPFSGLLIASWILYLECVDEKGEKYDIVDNRKQEILNIAKRSAQFKGTKYFLQNLSDVFKILSTNQCFLNQVERGYTSLKNIGVKQTLENYLK